METTENFLAQMTTALDEIEPILPSLISASDWQQVRPAIQAQLAALRAATDPDQQAVLAQLLLDVIRRYPLAEQQLQAILDRLAEDALLLIAFLHEHIEPQLLRFAIVEGLDPGAVKAMLEQIAPLITVKPDEVNERGIILSSGGEKGGTLVGVKYLEFDLWKWSALFAGIAFTTVDIQGVPWLLPFGLLLTLKELRDLMTETLEQQDATVLWGLMHATGRPEYSVGIHRVVEITNRERQRFALSKLDIDAIRGSLNKLRRLGIAAHDENSDQWKFIERIIIECW